VSWPDRFGWRLAKVVLLLVIVVPPVGVSAVDGDLRTGRFVVSLLALAAAGTAVFFSKSWPLPAAIIVALAVLAFQTKGLPQLNGAAAAGLMILVFLLAIRLGDTPLWSCAIGVIALWAGLQLFQVANPIYVVLTVGPAAVGGVLASHRRLAARLAERSEEISQERERYNAHAVRYERARVARELHDIVAHCVSLIVVQAGAGQRAPSDTSLAIEAFDNIAAAVSQAQAEIDLLIELLASDPMTGQASPLTGLRQTAELVERATATGMTITVDGFDAVRSGCPPEVAEIVYRVVQEGLTNALKHAPGAHVTVSVADLAHDGWAVTVDNGPRHTSAGALGGAGGGYGLTGIEERVRSYGGELTYGATDGGGWSLCVTLPQMTRTDHL
jgi:signal transduction histidine kinase